MSNPIIYPLFSTPVYVDNVGDFPRPDLRSLEFASGDYGFLSSVDKNVLHRPEFSHVHDLVTREIDAYTREVLAVNNSIGFYVTNSWINIHRPGQSAGPHVHNNSLISGVLYLRVTETSGDLVFQRDIHSQAPFPPALDLDMDFLNLYNCKSWGHKPKTNDVCLFPSVVMHATDRNESNDDRWCLAFNVFVRGDLGGLPKLSIR
jgi:uncharacterized protein (TIGR02466 family)